MLIDLAQGPICIVSIPKRSWCSRKRSWYRALTNSLWIYAVFRYSTWVRLLGFRLARLKRGILSSPNSRFMMEALEGEDRICSSSLIIFSSVLLGMSSDPTFFVYFRLLMGLPLSTSTEMLLNLMCYSPFSIRNNFINDLYIRSQSIWKVAQTTSKMFLPCYFGNVYPNVDPSANIEKSQTFSF